MYSLRKGLGNNVHLLAAESGCGDRWPGIRDGLRVPAHSGRREMKAELSRFSIQPCSSTRSHYSITRVLSAGRTRRAGRSGGGSQGAPDDPMRPLIALLATGHIGAVVEQRPRMRGGHRIPPRPTMTEPIQRPELPRDRERMIQRGRGGGHQADALDFPGHGRECDERFQPLLRWRGRHIGAQHRCISEEQGVELASLGNCAASTNTSALMKASGSVPGQCQAAGSIPYPAMSRTVRRICLDTYPRSL